eukprot:TRINITY_DN975_c0_g5_i1.p1 TRINITY_DN975_c0_g5~~TRINITY_DN975_c0_g5_i1.p1  ORF type:complete len:444 (+),score=92.37 TRINITY_DN975_c0_g5_i1:190-1521(+)
MSGKSNSVDLSYLGSKKLKKGEKQLLEQTEGWASGPSKAEKKDQKETIKAIKKSAFKKAEKVSWRKRAGGIVIVVAICGVGFFNFLCTIWDFVIGDGVHVVDVHDTAKLKSVLFGGDPWLVYCVTNQTQNERMPKVLEDSARTLYGNIGVSVAALKCWDQTESGRSVAQRFKLRTSPPLAFFVANGNTPRVVNFVGLSKPEDLEKKLKPAMKVDVSKIDTLKKWPSLCTSRRTCVIVGHKQAAQKETALNLVRPLLEQHRRVKFVTLDTAFWQLKLDEKLLKTRPGGDGKQKGADVICLVRDDSASKDSNASHSAAFLPQLTSSAMSSFVKNCESRGEGLVPIPAAPKLQARPSKPKKVTPPRPRPRPPAPRPQPPKKVQRSNVDHVGSRAKLEQQAEEEALFEAVEESEDAETEEDESESSEEDADDEGGSDDGSDDDEIEL